MTPRERLKAGSSGKVNPFMASYKPPVAAQPKPWDDKDSPPYPGNPDSDGGPYGGDGDTSYQHPPGEEIKVPPHSVPPSDDSLHLRASLETAAEASRDPEVQQAMRAIEARLAEITQYMKIATRGASKDMSIKLGVLAHII